MAQTIIVVVDDLFFASKIRGAGEQAGVDIIFAKTVEAVITAAESQRPSLVIADLHSKQCNPIQLAKRVKSHQELKTVPLVGFFSHVQVELKRGAEEAGFDHTIPRSALSNFLADMLKAPESGGLYPV